MDVGVVVIAGIPDPRLERVAPARGVGVENPFDLIPHPPEDLHPLLLASRRVRRIVKTPMVPVALAGEHRAGLIRIATHRDHRFHVAIEEFIHVLAVVRRYVDPDLGERPDGHRVDVARGV
jgi:hypothetical protein